MKKCISNKELDELGEGLVLTHIKKSGRTSMPRCVDIEGIANSLGLKVTYEQFAEDDYDKIGFLADGVTPLKVRRSGRIVSFLFPLGTIVVDISLRRESESGRRRFTIAHEVAHFILNRHNPAPQYQRAFDADRCYTAEELKRQFNLVETQADKLAASILMPYFIVEIALKEHNNGNKLKIYGDYVLTPEDHIIIEKMAAQIGVSYTALLIRLKQFAMLSYRPITEYIESNIMMEVNA